MIGADGTVVRGRQVKGGEHVGQMIEVRSKPGTFEWKYGHTGEVHHHAGSEFASKWVRAGMSIRHPLDIEPGSAGGGGGWRGIPEAKANALDEVLKITRQIGGQTTRRLVAYCVEGRTMSELARTYSVAEGRMYAAIEDDLTRLAKAMQFSN